MHSEKEDTGADRKARDFIGGLEATHNRHADVHDDDIRSEFLSQSHGFLPVSSFAANLPFGFRFEYASNSLAYDLVIVGNQYFYGHLSLIAKIHKRQIPQIMRRNARAA